MARALSVLVLLAGAASCGALPGRSKAPPASPTVPPTPAVTQLHVVPESARFGTTFTISASGFKPGESVVFKIDYPDGRSLTGAPHIVSSTGDVEARFTPSTPGDYAVSATGNAGSRGQGQFTVTGGSPSSSPRASASPSARPAASPRATAGY